MAVMALLSMALLGQVEAAGLFLQLGTSMAMALMISSSGLWKLIPMGLILLVRAMWCLARIPASVDQVLAQALISPLLMAAMVLLSMALIVVILAAGLFLQLGTSMATVLPI